MTFTRDQECHLNFNSCNSDIREGCGGKTVESVSMLNLPRTPPTESALGYFFSEFLDYLGCKVRCDTIFLGSELNLSKTTGEGSTNLYLNSTISVHRSEIGRTCKFCTLRKALLYKASQIRSSNIIGSKVETSILSPPTVVL